MSRTLTFTEEQLRKLIYDFIDENSEWGQLYDHVWEEDWLKSWVTLYFKSKEPVLNKIKKK